MTKNINISIFIFTFAVFGFLFLALPDHAVSSDSEYCCINDDTFDCVGCESGCSTTFEFCTSGDNNAVGPSGTFCISDGPGTAACADTAPDPGCCVTPENECFNGLTPRECFDGEGGVIWNPNVSCSIVPGCIQQTANVPTLSEWGLIATAGILGIIGLIMAVRRNRAAA